ncbi:hypothetical protein [Pelagicoccus mobilis]|uniref:Uncharacterized protein n=1 Tax=Pelagicoccus mobilis TaxID=415221 RepID=A0A934S1N6_9BACT|nr:hypothetical protein [Pelagicoccus mobilis]MBK1879525.1 hypothetical protein [Pelagicoccus mobilis]
MKLHSAFLENLPIAAQLSDEAESSDVGLAISGEVGFIILGTLLLAVGSYVLIAKLCRSLASSGSE